MPGGTANMVGNSPVSVTVNQGAVVTNFVLLEDGFNFLLETGDKLIKET